MNCRRLLPALVLLLHAMASLHAQAHLSVELQDPVYQLLEAAELKGVLGTLSAVRPYSLSRVLALLDRMGEARERFSPAEQAVLDATRQRLGEDRSGIRHGNISYQPAEAGARDVAVGADVQSHVRLNANSAEDWYLDSVMRPYLRGDMGESLSYLGILGFTFDRVQSEEAFDLGESPAAFPPYGFTKQWDAFHLSFGADRYSHGELDYPTVSYNLEAEIAADLLDNDLRLGFARQRREWGIGDGSLTLGGSARPFMGAETHYQPAPWLIGHYLVGSLANWEQEPGGGTAGTITYQKLFALQRMEFIPFPWLYLSATSTVLGARRFELTYLSPLLFGVLAQNLIGDLDNVGVDVDVAFTVPRFGKAYVSFYADEMEITNLAELFTQPRNMFALQGGFKVPVPSLPFTTLTLQYTKIEPFTYAHYLSWYPDYRAQVETSYTHDGENLAYPLYPNSDEFLLKVASLPFAGFRGGLEYRLIRHGDNPSANPGDSAILGRPDGYLDFALIGTGLTKDFLHDGLYDFNHIVTLSGDYTIPDLPITVGLSYTFAYRYWEPNASGEPDRPDTIQNIVGLTVKVFR